MVFNAPMCGGACPLICIIISLLFKMSTAFRSDPHFSPGAVSVVYNAKFSIRERRPRSGDCSREIFLASSKIILKTLPFAP